MGAIRMRALAAAALVASLVAPVGAGAGGAWIHPVLARHSPNGLGGSGPESSRRLAASLLRFRDARHLEARRQLDALARERVLAGESLRVRTRGSVADVAALEARSLEAERRAGDRDLADLVALAVRSGWRLGPTTRRVLLESRLTLREADRLEEVEFRAEVLEREVSRRDAARSLAWPRPGSSR